MQKLINFVRKHRYPFLVAVICAALASAALADILFTASTNYNNDRFGLILGTDEPIKNVVTNLGGTNGTQVSSFIDPNGEPRVAVSQYAGGSDTVWIYDTTDPGNRGTWTKPLKEITSSVFNIRGMAACGDYLYMIGYDLAQVSVCDMNNDYATVNTTIYGENGCHGEAIVAYQGSIYALFTKTSNAWDPSTGYGKSVLVQYRVAADPTSLKPVKELELNCTNVDGGGVHGAVCLDGHTLYIASIGGYQHYDGTPNDDSMVEAVDLNTMKNRVLVRNSDLYDTNTRQSAKYPEISSWTTDFRVLTTTPSGDVYIASGGWGPNNEYVFKTTLGKLEKGDLGELVKHFSWSSAFIPFSIGYDVASGLIWTNGAEGDADYNGSMFSSSDGGQTWLKHDSTALGGDVAAWNFLYTGEILSVKSLKLSQSNLSMKPNDTQKLDVTIVPSMAANKGVRWESTNTSVAAIDQNGVVTGKAPGSAAIKAYAADGSGVSSTCSVTVTPVLVSSIKVTGETSIVAGKTAQMSLTVAPDDATDKSVAWTSSSTDIAVVDSDGKVSGLKAGTVTITATANDRGHAYGAKEITIKPAVVPALVITGDDTLLEGYTLTLKAVTVPESVGAKNVTWASASPDIAVVNGTGVVTGVKAGVSVITAVASDGSGLSASRKITVQMIIGDTSVSTPVLPVLQEGVNAVPKKAITALTANDGAVVNSFTSADVLTAKNGSLYLLDEVTEKAAEGSGASYNSVTALPVFELKDSKVKRGGLFAAAFNVSGEKFGAAGTADRVQLLNIFPDGTGKLFSYVASAAEAADMSFTIMDQDGNIVTAIDPSKTYTVVTFIADGSDFDLDKKDEGVVVSSMAILSVKKAQTVTSGDAGNGAPISGSGCNAGFTALMLFALLPFALRKTR